MRALLLLLAASAILLTPLVSGSVERAFQARMIFKYNIDTDDTVFIGENQSPDSAEWFASNLTKRYACAQNENAGTEASSVSLLSGGGFRSLNYSSGTEHTFHLTQDYGEPFYIAMADANCSRTQSNAPAVENGNVAGFGDDPDVTATQLFAWIPYPDLNLTREERLPEGTHDLLVKNNGTVNNVTRIEVELD